MEKIEQVFLSKTYLNILSEVPFTLRINATSADGRTAQDELKYSAGQYSVKISTFLDEFQDGETAKAKYNAWVVYDDELGRCDWYTTWINAQSVQSINQNIAELSAPQFNQIKESSATTAEMSVSIEDNTTELVSDLKDVRQRLQKIEECLDDVQTGSINNKVEQIRTLLKSPIGAGSGVYSSLDSRISTFMGASAGGRWVTLSNGDFSGAFVAPLGAVLRLRAVENGNLIDEFYLNVRTGFLKTYLSYGHSVSVLILCNGVIFKGNSVYTNRYEHKESDTDFGNVTVTLEYWEAQ